MLIAISSSDLDRGENNATRVLFRVLLRLVLFRVLFRVLFGVGVDVRTTDDIYPGEPSNIRFFVALDRNHEVP